MKFGLALSELCLAKTNLCLGELCRIRLRCSSRLAECRSCVSESVSTNRLAKSVRNTVWTATDGLLRNVWICVFRLFEIDGHGSSSATCRRRLTLYPRPAIGTIRAIFLTIYRSAPPDLECHRHTTPRLGSKKYGRDIFLPLLRTRTDAATTTTNCRNTAATAARLSATAATTPRRPVSGTGTTICNGHNYRTRLRSADNTIFYFSATGI